MGKTYFDNIPLWTDSGKRFETLADEISGRIPVTKLERWLDFSELLEDEFFNQPGIQLIFRGHRRYDWNLLPTLGRLTPTGIVTEDIANKQLEQFRRAVRGRLHDYVLVEEGQEDELWSIGQHHGLKTPLLDWTHSPYVALFFTFEEEDPTHEEDNQYRAVYILNKTFICEDQRCSEIRIMEPRRDDHGRLVNQAGLFTFSPTDATIENKLIEILSSDDSDELKDIDEEREAEILAKYICKVYIKNEDREGCLRHLRRMNVHHASLFPDLFGASDYCNILIEEEQKQREIEESEKELEEKKDEEKIVKDEISEKIDEILVDLQKTISLKELLNAPEESSQVEPGRIELIAKQLNKELQKYKVVDWESRESILAKLRNIARVILRKYGYPVAAREVIVDRIVEFLTNEEEG